LSRDVLACRKESVTEDSKSWGAATAKVRKETANVLKPVSSLRIGKHYWKARPSAKGETHKQYIRLGSGGRFVEYGYSCLPEGKTWLPRDDPKNLAAAQNMYEKVRLKKPATGCVAEAIFPSRPMVGAVEIPMNDINYLRGDLRRTKKQKLFIGAARLNSDLMESDLSEDQLSSDSD